MLHAMFSEQPAKARLLGRGDKIRLLASFETSVPPTVWHFDFEKEENATFSIRETEAGWELGIARDGQKFSPVARFDSGAKAQEAFAAVNKVLMGKRVSNFDLAVRAGLVLLLSFVFWAVFFAPAAQMPLQEPANQATVEAPSPETAGPTGPKEIINGMPMNADDVLVVPPED